LIGNNIKIYPENGEDDEILKTVKNTDNKKSSENNEETHKPRTNTIFSIKTRNFKL